MAIIAPQTARNFAHGEYHRINKIESDCSPMCVVPCWLVWVGFYATEEARDLNPVEPLYTNCYRFAFSDLPGGVMPPGDPRPAFYELLMTIEPFATSNAISDEAAG